MGEGQGAGQAAKPAQIASSPPQCCGAPAPGVSAQRLHLLSPSLVELVVLNADGHDGSR